MAIAFLKSAEPGRKEVAESGWQTEKSRLREAEGGVTKGRMPSHRLLSGRSFRECSTTTPPCVASARRMDSTGLEMPSGFLGSSLQRQDRNRAMDLATPHATALLNDGSPPALPALQHPVPRAAAPSSQPDPELTSIAELQTLPVCANCLRMHPQPMEGSCCRARWQRIREHRCTS